ncbi:hypothetical protein F8165_15130 [Bacillus cereus]|uniref:Uncharacterized protein n=1 Tax=Bacillus cereus TaxID=1396 RepID=A0AAN6B7A7_BACCE|nr:hypothetical protein F8165_15130 [Bacillus cereus]KAB2485509.1 hypothetical protein F8157_15975 [Bacillus cereus]
MDEESELNEQITYTLTTVNRFIRINKTIGLNEAIFLQQVKNRSNKIVRFNLLYLQQALQECV